MPYDCNLTSSNRVVYEQRILRRLNLFNISHDAEDLYLLITFIIEYLLALAFIDTKEKVFTKVAINKLGVSDVSKGMLFTMLNIRHAFIHNPCALNDAVLASFRSCICEQGILELSSLFINKEPIQRFFTQQSYVTKYSNIEEYKRRFNMTDAMFKDDMQRLMLVLNVQTVDELNERIVDLL